MKTTMEIDITKITAQSRPEPTNAELSAQISALAKSVLELRAAVEVLRCRT